MHQQDSIKIERLQQQVNSLKSMSAIKIELLQSQLEQSNNIVSNLSSLSTGFGTVYTINSILIGVLTVEVPLWV